MKSISLFSLLLVAGNAIGQVKTYEKAIISTTVNVVAPDEEDVQNIQQESRGGQGFRNMMDGETKVETFVSNENVKTTLRSDMGRSTIFRNNQLKTTTTIMEMMGNVNGFTATDEEQAAMQRRRDSIMAERRKKDTTSGSKTDLVKKSNTPQVEIAYTSDTKTIAGHVCKKAYLVTTRLLGIKDSTTIWVATDFKVRDLNFTGISGVMPGMRNMGNLNGADKAEGFIMAYTMKMPRGRIMDVLVTKIALDPKMDEKEFQLPKNVEIKPLSEMQNMFRGGGGFRD